MIYFVKCVDDPSRVKIGKTKSIARRMDELARFPSAAWQNESEVRPLELVATCEGYTECEAALHRLLGPWRLNGEWFDATNKTVKRVIEHVKKDGLIHLMGNAVKGDRIGYCTHDSIRALHPKNECMVCDDVGGIDPTATPRTTNAGAALAPMLGMIPQKAPEVEANAILGDLGADLDARVSDEERVLAEAIAELLREQRGIDAELARRDFKEFVLQAIAAGVVQGLTKIEWTPHLDALCDVVQTMFDGWLVANGKADRETIERVEAQWRTHGLVREKGACLVQNTIVNIPPATLKSTIIMVLAPAWMWLRAPTFLIGCLSATDKVVERDSVACRDIVTSVWYREHFGITWTIRKDMDAVGTWATTAGGKRISRTILAAFVGVHVHFLAADDPNDPDKVYNEPERRRVQDRWSRAIENRVVDERTCLRLIVQQRVHVDDLTAYLLARMMWAPERRRGWAWVCIPMESGRGPAESNVVSPFAWRDMRDHGEVLQPSRFPREVLDDIRTMKGEHSYEAQYNQNPAPLDGGMIKRVHHRFFRFEDQPIPTRPRPEGCLSHEEFPAYVLGRNRKTGRYDLDCTALSVDATFGSVGDNASAVGLLVIGNKGLRRFVLDDATRPMDYPTTKAAIRRLLGRWHIDRVLIERKANGASIITELTEELASGKILGPDGKPVIVPVEAIETGGDSKEGRAVGMVPAYESGHVFVLDGAPWLYPGEKGDVGHITEISVFPNGKRNDRVDSMSQHMTYYRTANEGIHRARVLNTW